MSAGSQEDGPAGKLGPKAECPTTSYTTNGQSSTERFLNALETHGFDPKPSGNSHSAKCPAHEDRKPSLSVTEGDDGRTLVCCHAGCDPADIVAAVGLTMSDLMGSNRNGQPNGKTPTKPPTIFRTAAAAIASLERTKGKPSATWTYRNAGGDPVGVIVRWNLANGKEIRPVSRNGKGWIVGGMAEGRPLYRLTELADAKRVYVTEGEKAADAARSIGLVATTSPHGSQSASKANWTPLAGKDVIILPDNDDAGHRYASDVAGILAKLTPPATVRIVELPGLPAGGDLFDWIENHGDAAEPDSMRAELEELVAAAELVTVEPPAVVRFKPFPVDALPEPIRSFVVDGSRAIGCDASYVALPLLGSVARAVGNSRVIRLKSTWQEPPILWGALVGKSGTHKTPALQMATNSLMRRQSTAMETYAKEKAAYEIELAKYEKELADYRKKKGGTPPEKPKAPVCQRIVCSDITIEALADRLSSQADGVIVIRDELAGWLDGLAEYKGGKGSDTGHWLAAWSGAPMTVDRKTGPKPIIHIERAIASIIGGIQPGVLQRAIGREHLQDGLCARLLMAWPPTRPVVWTEATLSPTAHAEIDLLLNELFGLMPADDNKPIALGLNDDAKALWVCPTSTLAVWKWLRLMMTWRRHSRSWKPTRPGLL